MAPANSMPVNARLERELSNKVAGTSNAFRLIKPGSIPIKPYTGKKAATDSMNTFSQYFIFFPNRETAYRARLTCLP